MYSGERSVPLGALVKTIFSRLHVFWGFFFYLFYYFAIKPWNEGFFLICRDLYACTKGSDHPPLFFYFNETFFYENEEFMHVFWAQWNDNIPFLFYVIFIGNFGDSRYLVLKIIVLVQIYGIQVPLYPGKLIHSLCTIALTLQNFTTSKNISAKVTRFSYPAVQRCFYKGESLTWACSFFVN